MVEGHRSRKKEGKKVITDTDLEGKKITREESCAETPIESSHTLTQAALSFRGGDMSTSSSFRHAVPLPAP